MWLSYCFSFNGECWWSDSKSSQSGTNFPIFHSRLWNIASPWNHQYQSNLILDHEWLKQNLTRISESLCYLWKATFYFKDYNISVCLDNSLLGWFLSYIKGRSFCVFCASVFWTVGLSPQRLNKFLWSSTRVSSWTIAFEFLYAPHCFYH